MWVERFVRKHVLAWADRQMDSRQPDFVVDSGQDGLYMERWYLWRGRWCSLYLHRFLQSDDEILHDHPYANVTWVLRTGYLEEIQSRWGVRLALRSPGDLVVRRAVTGHRVVVAPIGPRPVSLFLCGPRIRTWGFHCHSGWVPWHEYVNVSSTGHSRHGRGCP